LALVAAVALHETASALAPGAEPRLKWPNDLLAGGAKLAGILLEREGEAVIVGFGVNLAGHPAESGRPATSFRAVTGSAPDPDAFCERLAGAFGRWLGRWRGEGLSAVRAAWLAAAHPIGTALATHSPDGAPVEGLFDGLDESGALRLRLADGTRRVIHAGDVFLA
jgi:BirA family biotin operon repressor/biotin-[acetyl-CoA-carboxylase] ligase